MKKKEILLFLFLMGALAISGHAQQQVRGSLPDGVFAIDPNKVCSWNSKIFSEGGKQFSVKDFKSQNLERWNHEFPTKYARWNDKVGNMGEVELKKWDGASSRKWNAEKESKEYKTSEYKPSSKSADTLVTNEKWDRPETKAKTTIVAADFIARVGVRPMEVPELQEKLNEYSRPAGQRQSSPSLPQKTPKL